MSSDPPRVVEADSQSGRSVQRSREMPLATMTANKPLLRTEVRVWVFLSALVLGAGCAQESDSLDQASLAELTAFLQVELEHNGNKPSDLDSD